MWRESQFQDILNARARETQFTTPSRSMRDAGASLRNTESKYEDGTQFEKENISTTANISRIPQQISQHIPQVVSQA